MQEPQQDATGDYGYDLVHEDLRAGRPPVASARREPAPPVKRAGTDLEGDLGYDEAHGY